MKKIKVGEKYKIKYGFEPIVAKITAIYEKKGRHLIQFRQCYWGILPIGIKDTTNKKGFVKRWVGDEINELILDEL